MKSKSKRKQNIQFSESDKEWIQTIVNFLFTIFDVNQMPIVIFSREHYNSYCSKVEKLTTEKGGCIQDKGVIYINSKYHSKEPRKELLSTIVHEVLHLKFQSNATEYQIRKYTGLLVK